MSEPKFTRARARRARRITFVSDPADRDRVRAFRCSRGHLHADFMHALACEGARR